MKPLQLDDGFTHTLISHSKATMRQSLTVISDDHQGRPRNHCELDLQGG